MQEFRCDCSFDQVAADDNEADASVRELRNAVAQGSFAGTFAGCYRFIFGQDLLLTVPRDAPVTSATLSDRLAFCMSLLHITDAPKASVAHQVQLQSAAHKLESAR